MSILPVKNSNIAFLFKVGIMALLIVLLWLSLIPVPVV